MEKLPDTFQISKKIKKLTILLADDDIDDCNFFKQALDKLSLSTNLKTVKDGEELMLLLNNETIDLPHILFLDINMPRKNGFECLSEIKKNERLKDLPIVIFSTSNTKENINHAFKVGANIYIRKPGNFNQLMQVIQHSIPIASDEIVSNNQLKYILNA